MNALIHAELLKLRSTRSAWIPRLVLACETGLFDRDPSQPSSRDPHSTG